MALSPAAPAKAAHSAQAAAQASAPPALHKSQCCTVSIYACVAWDACLHHKRTALQPNVQFAQTTHLSAIVAAPAVAVILIGVQRTCTQARSSTALIAVLHPINVA